MHDEDSEIKFLQLYNIIQNTQIYNNGNDMIIKVHKSQKEI